MTTALSRTPTGRCDKISGVTAWRQVVITLIVAICLLAPIFEHFDHWDNFPRSETDIVLTLTAALLAAGLALAAQLLPIGRLVGRTLGALVTRTSACSHDRHTLALFCSSAALAPATLRI